MAAGFADVFDFTGLDAGVGATVVWADRVHQLSTTTGTGSLTFSSTPVNKRAFADVLEPGDMCYGFVAHQSKAEWETCLFTMLNDGTLQRTKILQSSNNDTSPVSFTTGQKDVALDLPAKVIFSILQYALVVAYAEPPKGISHAFR